MYKYSKTKNCFFCVELGGIIPDDAVEISDELHAELIDALSSGTVTLSGDNKGYPILIDNLPPTPDELRSSMVVTKLKAKQNLKLAGKLNFVLGAMDAEPRDSDIRILWDESPEFHRLDATLVGFCKDKMGMSDEDIDSLFL